MVDRVILVCTVILACAYLYATSQMSTPQIGDPLGPKAFPFLLGIATLLVAGLLLIEMLRGRKAVPDIPRVPITAADRRHLPVIAAVVVGIALYYALFEKLGYMIATTLFLLAMTAFFHRGKWLTNALVAVLFSVISYLLFTKVLGVSLAKGLIPL